ncbi:hypothetical protein NIES4073_27610 [Kalymmatonema gypsitolerans NIES-4073]|nr:hypothetical protein NIES4073_27610 [Scytonema sp. NIES-4073]
MHKTGANESYMQLERSPKEQCAPRNRHLSNWRIVKFSSHNIDYAKFTVLICSAIYIGKKKAPPYCGGEDFHTLILKHYLKLQEYEYRRYLRVKNSLIKRKHK